MRRLCFSIVFAVTMCQAALGAPWYVCKDNISGPWDGRSCAACGRSITKRFCNRSGPLPIPVLMRIYLLGDHTYHRRDHRCDSLLSMLDAGGILVYHVYRPKDERLLQVLIFMGAA